MVAPIPTPNIPEGSGTFSAHAKGTINASASTIYNALVDTSTWPEWCSFLPKIEITSRPPGDDPDSTIMTTGTAMKFHVQMSPNIKTKSPERADPIPPPPRVDAPPGTKTVVGWVADAPSWALRAQRINEIITTGDPNVCEYATWETFAGPLATVVSLTLGGTLDARFEDWYRDLKAYCEQKDAGGAGTAGI